MLERITLVAAVLLSTIGHASAALNVEKLRCEYQTDPLGIDVPTPRLSWIVQSDERGQRQTAYQVLVASTPEALAKDQGDLWDSGRVESDQTMHIAYAGKPLGTRMQCFWKIRAWEKAGLPSTWSKPANWTMGLLKPSDWDAKWIAYHDPSEPPPATPHNGYHSEFAASADATKWVAIDLGSDRKVDGVRLFPTRPFDWPDTPGFLFPVRFKIETALKADFSDAKTVVDQTGANVPNPGLSAPVYHFEPTEARYVRLTVTQLAPRGDSGFAFALAEMQVLAGEDNLAQDAAVTALDAVESVSWSKTKLVDNRTQPERGGDDGSQRPATMARKEFDIRGPIKRAVVSVTGLGLYELHINGQRIGDQVLAPEWTRYGKRIQYQTYDVTDVLRAGPNAVGAQMCGGWWTGPMMFLPPMDRPRCCLLMRLDIELADGTTQSIVTDPSWQATIDGPIRRAGIYFGETYDATKEMPGWDMPGFAATLKMGTGSEQAGANPVQNSSGEVPVPIVQRAGWRPVQTLPHPDEAKDAVLVAQPNEPIRVVKELRPVKMTEPKPGVYVFDLGQNMVGWCRLRVDAPAGAKVTLRHAEALNDDGTIYTDNLRGAAQINEYTWRGGEAVVEPHFTYHGFRYVELTGVPNRPNEDAVKKGTGSELPDANAAQNSSGEVPVPFVHGNDAVVVGRVFYSAATDTGTISSSNELLNQIMHCVEWVQRGNMHSVPTDCPQRTEREGWMGDIQAFSQTAIFNMDMAGFFTKWVPDIRDSQADDGRYPDVAPHMADPNLGFSGAPAWGDAGTVVPWRMYQNYADVRMLEQHFDSAQRWVEFIHVNNPDLLWRQKRGNDYNDWLNGDTLILDDYPRGISVIPNEVFATAFFAHSTEILAKMARVLRRDEDAAEYAKLFEAIKAAFNKEYVDADGRICGDTQAGYALALHFNLLDDSLRPKATKHLVEAIGKYKDHPSTGIQSTHRMMLELTRNGRHDEAYRLINLRTVPSWGYMVDAGATTIWERWDGYVKGRGFQDPGMNSLNHWALGSVGEWVWRELAGINPDEQQPGYKHFLIRPRPCGDLTWVKARYDSIRGPITSEWKIADGRLSLHVEIPANTTATVFVPTSDPAAVREGNVPAAQSPGVSSVGKVDGAAAIFKVESGSYDFTAPK